MPYMIEKPPEQIKDLPKRAQEIFIAAYNSAYEQYDKDDAKAAATAWAAVKKSYEQDKDGNWVKIEKAEEDKLETVDIDGVESLAVGTWQGVKGPAIITEQDLKDAVASFNALTSNTSLNYEPPVKLGHNNTQSILKEDGLPAAGWVKSIRQVGKKLVFDLKGVPKKVAQLMEAGAYKKRSAEYYRNYEIGGKRYPFVVKALSLLGADIPAVKTISDIQALYTSEGLLDESRIPYEIAILEESLDKTVQVIREAYYSQARETNPMDIPVERDAGWVQEVYPDYIIVNKADQYFKIPYSNTGELVFDMAKAVQVERVYQEIKNNKQEESMSEKDIRELLGLDEKADVLAAVSGLKSKAESVATSLAEGEQLKTRVTKLEEDLSKSNQTIALKERDERVNCAINTGRVLPAQRPWAEEYALKDPTGFDAFVRTAPVVVKLGEIGTQGGAPEEVQLSESELKLAEKLGVSKEALIKAKKQEGK